MWGLVYEMAVFFLIAELSLAVICLTWYRNALAARVAQVNCEQSCTDLLHEYVAEASRRRIQSGEAFFWKQALAEVARRRNGEDRARETMEVAELYLADYLTLIRTHWVDSMAEACENQPLERQPGLKEFMEEHFPNT